ncbi:zinc ribbon domain-containing protein, partial [Alistipes putredinis]|uniref:zinc ribbon domain-containing protein n=1 Tax=Alistipes putredinis TaxID=28117 RepID=UPI003AB39A60
VISHKTLYISDYIFSCYAFLFIFDFPNPLSKHILQFHAFLFCKWVESAPVSKKFDCMIEDRWKCQNCGNSVPDGLTVCPKCGLVKGGFDELPKHTADGLEIARVEQKVKVEIPFILYLGTVCSIILLAIVVYIYVAIKL